MERRKNKPIKNLGKDISNNYLKSRGNNNPFANKKALNIVDFPGKLDFFFGAQEIVKMIYIQLDFMLTERLALALSTKFYF